MQTKRGQQRPVQRPLILDVLPADVAPRLDVLPVSFAKRFVRKIPQWMRHWWTAAMGVIIIATAVILVWRPWYEPPVALPASITSQIGGFKPYFLSSRSLAGLTLNESNISYSDGVLFFQLHDQNGDSVVVSEQALPVQLQHNTPAGTPVTGARGTAAIDNQDSRTIGTLITSAQPRALISLNAPDSVSAATVKQVIQALKPIS